MTAFAAAIDTPFADPNLAMEAIYTSVDDTRIQAADAGHRGDQRRAGGAGLRLHLRRWLQLALRSAANVPAQAKVRHLRPWHGLGMAPGRNANELRLRNQRDQPFRIVQRRSAVSSSPTITRVGATIRPRSSSTPSRSMTPLMARHPWPGLKIVIVVDNTREGGTRTGQETRLYIASPKLDAKTLRPIIRTHWAIKCPAWTRSINSLHWVMGMVFRDDESRWRSKHTPANCTTIRHMAHNLIRKASAKGSFRLRRKGAAWDDDFLTSLLTASTVHPTALMKRTPIPCICSNLGAAVAPTPPFRR